jgi:hypothetical protein
MDPKIRSLGRTHDNLQEKSNSAEIKSTTKNPLEKHRASSKTQVVNNGGDVSTKNVKSEGTRKFNEKFNSGNSSNKPPPPKYPAPPPPFSIVGTPLNQSSLPPDVSLVTDMGKPPPHPTTPPPDFPLATDLGKPPPRPQGAPPDFPSPEQLGNLSHPIVDTKIYLQDKPLITITGDQKIPYRETSKISKQELAAGGLEFSRYIPDFFAKVARDEKTLRMISDYGLSQKEVAAIHAYTTEMSIGHTKESYYSHINNQFRHLQLDKVDIADANALINAGVQNVELADLIAALVRGIRKLPPTQTSDSAYLPVGRNVIMGKDELNLYVKDAEIIYKGFTSTTVSATSMVSSAVGFWDRKDIALVIYPRVNGNARDIGMFSAYPDEQEILFMPNTKFKVMFRSDPVETKSGASRSEVAALEALSSQELYEKLKIQADSGDANEKDEAKEALEGKEFSNELLFESGKATEAKNASFESNSGVLEKIFISIMEIPLDSSSLPGS